MRRALCGSRLARSRIVVSRASGRDILTSYPTSAFRTTPSSVTERSPEAGPAHGLLPGGSWEYRRTLERDRRRCRRRRAWSLEAVYRDAVVTVNGIGRGHQPSGYTGFFVPIDHLLHEGENEIKVEADGPPGLALVLGRGHLPERLAPRGRPVHLVPDHLDGAHA